jgi:hypothetical protein
MAEWRTFCDAGFGIGALNISDKDVAVIVEPDISVGIAMRRDFVVQCNLALIKSRQAKLIATVDN